eukprot:142881_1
MVKGSGFVESDHGILDECCSPVALEKLSPGVHTCNSNSIGEFDNGSIHSDTFERVIVEQTCSIDSSVYRYNFRQRYRTVPGRWGFGLLLVPERANKRPLGVKLTSIVQPFNADKFNFGKAATRELIGVFGANETGGPHNVSLTNLRNDTSLADKQIQSIPEIRTQDNLVLVNVAPCSGLHVLLVPEALSQRSQRLTEQGISTTLQAVSQMHSGALRVAFNSLGAFASVNHQHLHFYAMPQLTDEVGALREYMRQQDGGVPSSFFTHQSVAVERCPTRQVANYRGVTVATLHGYPTRGLVLSCDSFTDISNLCTATTTFVKILQSTNTAHNIMITPRTHTPIVSESNTSLQSESNTSTKSESNTSSAPIRVFIFPRLAQLETPDETRVNIAVLELGGQFILKTENQFSNISENDLCEAMGTVSLGVNAFVTLVNSFLDNLGIDRISVENIE